MFVEHCAGPAHADGDAKEQAASPVHAHDAGEGENVACEGCGDDFVGVEELGDERASDRGDDGGGDGEGGSDVAALAAGDHLCDDACGDACEHCGEDGLAFGHRGSTQVACDACGDGGACETGEHHAGEFAVAVDVAKP